MNTVVTKTTDGDNNEDDGEEDGGFGGNFGTKGERLAEAIEARAIEQS